MTKTLFRVICINAFGARSLSNPEAGLQDGELYDVVADIADAKTDHCPEGGAAGYVVRHADTGRVLPQVYKRDRFQKQGGYEAPAPAESRGIDVGDTVTCVDAVGARSFSQPETMLQQEHAYVVVADVSDATTTRKPNGGASGFMVQHADTGDYLAGVFRRSRFALA